MESGFTRAKNAGNIIMKNLIDFCFGTLLYWLIGFGIMFGGSSAIFGGIHFFAGNSLAFDLPTPTFLLFQTVFCATAATIVSGAMAERTNFIAYRIFSAVISGLIYPISGHWIWGGGFGRNGLPRFCWFNSRSHGWRDRSLHWGSHRWSPNR